MQYNVRAAGLSPAALFVSNYAKTRRDTLISRPIKGKITMENKKKRIVIALGGNALGNTLPEQMKAVKITAKAIVDLIGEGCEVIVAHGNGPQVGMINNAMAALSREDANQPNTPLSVCVAMSQAYIGYDLQNALREELYNREMYDIPVATMITQVRVDADDPAFEAPSKPIGHFMTEEQAKIAEEKYGYIMKEDSGRGYRRVVASPKPAEIVDPSGKPLKGCKRCNRQGLRK